MRNSNILFGIIPALLALYFISCSKSDRITPVTPPVTDTPKVPTTDTVPLIPPMPLLDSLITTTVNSISGKTVTYTTALDYNTDSTVKSLIAADDQNLNPSTGYFYTYENKRLVRANMARPANVKDTIANTRGVFLYNGLGQLIAIQKQTSKDSFVYNTDNQLGKIMYYTEGNLRALTELTWAGKNVTSRKLSYYWQGDTTIDTYSYKYDDKKNPVYASRFWVLQYEDEMDMSANNIIEMVVQGVTENYKITIKYNYTYNEQDYPVSAASTEVGVNYTEQSTVRYVYKKVTQDQ